MAHIPWKKLIDLSPPSPVIYHHNTASIDFNFNQFARFIILALVFLLPTGAPTVAQDCGLPSAGNISASVTYTLNSDCTQTGVLNLVTLPAGQTGTTLVIDGAGHTIKLGEGTYSFTSNNDSRNAVELKNVTIDGQLNERIVIIHGQNISAENVTFTRNHGTVISAYLVTMTNVLFDSNLFVGLGFGANGGTLNIVPNGSATVTNAVFRNNRNMNIGLHPGATLTTEGCLTFSGNLAYNVVHSGVWSGAGDWTDNSTGPCSDEIGNKGQAVLPEIRLMPCGLPAGLALIDTDTTFTLRRDCDGVTDIVVSEGKRATIRGNGHRISRDANLPTVFSVAGDASLTVSDAILDKGGQFLNFGTLTVSHTEVRNSTHLALINYGTASFSNMHFQDNSAASFAGLYYGAANYLKGIGTFSDSRFDGVSGADAALRATGSTAVLNLKGCIVFEGLAAGYPETIAQNGATLNDNRDPAACNPTVGPRPPVSNRTSAESTSTYTPPAGVCDGIPDALPIGAIACVFREAGRLMVYRVDEESRGHFRLGATQEQVDANGTGMVAASPNGFAAVYKLEDGNILVSVGPNKQGMTLNVTLDGGVNGRALSMTESYGPPPLSPPRTLQSCMVTALHVLNFRDAPAGNVKRILPNNVTLTAFERAPDWFYVDYHGDRGWIHADYVRTHGSCG